MKIVQDQFRSLDNVGAESLEYAFGWAQWFDKAVVQVFERLVYRSDSNISLIRISTHLIKAAEHLLMIVRSIEHHGIWSSNILQTWNLRIYRGFDGFVISDCDTISAISQSIHYTSSVEQAAAAAALKVIWNVEIYI